MVLVLINSLILLLGIGIPMGALFWKHFADKPSETVRAVMATVAGMIGLAVFFLQVFYMTYEPGKNLITIIGTWFAG